MYIRLVIILFILSCGYITPAQNLILNPGFDSLYVNNKRTICVDYNFPVWYNNGGNSPDMYQSSFGFSPSMGKVGSNRWGYQLPRSYGGFIGLLYFQYYNPDYFECVQAKMAAKLEVGATYIFEAYLSIDGGSLYNVAPIGVTLSTDSFNLADVYPINGPQTISFGDSFYITDSAGWEKVSACFKADSAYEYITLGKRRPESELSIIYYDTTNLGHGTQPWGACYIYWDDLSLIKIGDPFINKQDTLICANTTDSVVLWAKGGNSLFKWAEKGKLSAILGTDSFLKVRPNSTTTYVVFNAIKDTAEITVYVAQPPTFTLGKDTLLCNYSSYTLQAKLAPSLVKEYSWSTNSTSSTFTATKNNSLVWHQITDTNGCIWRDTINFSWQTPPVLQLFADTLICQGGIAQLQTEVTDSVSGATITASNYQLTWQTNPTLTTLTDSTAQAKPLADTRYFATVSDDKCTGNTDSVWVTVQANPITQLTPDTQRICLGQQAQVQASGGQTYVWSINGTLDAETNQSQLTQTPSNSLFVAVQAIQAPCVGQ